MIPVQINIPSVCYYEIYKNHPNMTPGYAIWKWIITEDGRAGFEGRGGIWSLDEVRAMILPGFHRFEPQENDAPHLIEVWL